MDSGPNGKPLEPGRTRTLSHNAMEFDLVVKVGKRTLRYRACDLKEKKAMST